MIQNDNYLYKYPHDQQLSLKHRHASRIFKTYSNKDALQLCHCCNKKIGDQQTPNKSIWFDPIELAFLGPGLPLFFCFLKNSVLLIFTYLLFYASLCIYSDMATDFCSKNQQCSQATVGSSSIFYQYQTIPKMQLQMQFMCLFSLFSLLIFQFLKNQSEKMNQKCDFLIDSASDYSIIIRRLPQNVTQNDIRQMVQKLKQTLNILDKKRTRNMEINQIILSYFMEKYRQLKQTNIENFKRYLSQGIPDQFVQEPFQGFNQSGDICVVVFQRQQAKQYFAFQPSLKQNILRCLWSPYIPQSHFQIKGQKVFIERAPQPNDIIWQNANVQVNEAVKRKTIFNLLGFVLLLIGCGLQYGLALAQEKVGENAKMFLSLISSVLISLSNYGILQFLRFASSQQRNLTHTEYNSVLMVKISYLQFLNAGIFLVISKSLAKSQKFQITDTLIFQINTIMILNALSHSVSVFILDYFQVTNKILLFLGRQGYLKFTQLQANELYQNTLPDMPYKYGYIIKTLWLTGFYTSFAPLCPIYSLIGLIFNYIVEKKLFAGSYSAPQMYSSILNQKGEQLMKFFPLSISMGGLVMFLDSQKETSGMSFGFFICALILSVIVVIFPFDKMHKKIFQNQRDSLMYFEIYGQVEHKIETTYKTTNPAYDDQNTRKSKLPSQMKKKVMIGDFQQVSINFDQVVNDTYKQKIESKILDVKLQILKNEEKDMRYYGEKRQEYKRDITFEQILVREQMDENSELRNLLDSGTDWKKQMRLLQIYDPLKLDSQKVVNNHRVSDFKSLRENKKHIQSLFGSYFNKKSLMEDGKKTNNKQIETVIGEQEINEQDQQRQKVSIKYIQYDEI